MFDERSVKWIKIYKCLVICVYIAFMCLALFLPLGDNTVCIVEDGFLNYLLVFTVISAVASFYLIINMLLINFLSKLHTPDTEKEKRLPIKGKTNKS